MFVEGISSKLCRCLPALLSYWCDISEEKDRSGVLPGISLPRLWGRCLSMVWDNRHPPCQQAHNLAEANEARENGGEKAREAVVQIVQGNLDGHRWILKCVKQMWKSLLPFHWDSFSEQCEMISPNISLYLIFTSEPLANFCFGIQKLVKECTNGYHSSNSLRTNPDKAESGKDHSA